MRLVKKMNGDCLTPVSLYLRLSGESKCLLESIPRESDTGRYSIIAFNPVHHITFQEGVFACGEKKYLCSDPLKELEKYVFTDQVLKEQLPFQGGAIGYAGYDLAATYEDLGTLPPDELGIPEMQFYLFENFVIYDHQQEEITIVVENSYSQATESELAAKLAQIEQEVLQVQAIESQPLEKIDLSFSSNFTQAEFEAVVKKAKQKITEGDMFQVVPSQRLTADFPVDPFAYYRHLRLSNPSAYLYFLDFPDVKIIGSSPESLVRVKGDIVTTNPIAGTRKRGATKAEDDDLAKELVEDPKEIAEHKMLIDLGRNDLGKVSELGSVTIPLFMTIEWYRYVMHIVSLVAGKLKPSATAMDALKATLPAGTVSGAPKIRAMQRIYQWEPVRRNIYAGAVGYLSQDNQADFAIAIRTMMVKDQKAYVQAGAGIVFDSDPTSEYFETLQKAKALLEVGK
ncbi:MAG: anthranilate synthase component I [Enterococcus sp.]